MSFSGSQEGVLTLTNGEIIHLPVAFSAMELTLPGNSQFVGVDLLYGYDPTTGTGVLWFRKPAPHWQMVQPITRMGFIQWAGDHYANLVQAGSIKGGELFGLDFAGALQETKKPA